MSQSLFVHELSHKAAVQLLGAPLTTDHFIIPELPLPSEVAIGDVIVTPADIPAKDHAPAGLLDQLVAGLPRHERGPACNPDGVTRRLELAASWGDLAGVPAQNPISALDQAYPYVRELLRRRLESLALPMAAAVQSLVQGGCPFDRGALAAMGEEIAQEGAVWPWDAEGAPLDAAAAEQAAVDAQKAAHEAAERAWRDAINTKTCDELGIAAVENLRRPGSFRFIETASFAGLRPPHFVDHHQALEIHGPDFVPPVRNDFLYDGYHIVVGTNLDLFIAARRGVVDRSAITSFRDLSSVDGLWALEKLETEILPRFVARIVNQEPRAAEVLLQAVLRGLRLRPDLVLAAVKSALDPVWQQMSHPFSNDLAFYNEASRILAGGVGALVSPDELFGDGPTSEDVVRLAPGHASDPWREALETFAAGQTLFTSEDVVAHLKAAGLLERAVPSPRDHSRILAILTSFDFVKKTIPADVPGSRKRVFAKRGVA